MHRLEKRQINLGILCTALTLAACHSTLPVRQTDIKEQLEIDRATGLKLTTAELQPFIQGAYDDMRQEEEYLLTEDMLHDDAVGIDVVAG